MLAANLINPMIPLLKPNDSVGTALDWMDEFGVKQLVIADSGVLDGAMAGVGFAGTFIGLGRLHEDPGWWPLVTSQATSAVTVVVLASLMGAALFPLPRAAWRAWFGGPLGSTALVLFRAAASAGLMTVAVVITSLYPATTILLAVVLLKERVTRLQGLGLTLCAVCVGLVAAG